MVTPVVISGSFRENQSYSGTIWAKADFRDPSRTQVRIPGLSRRFRDSWQLCLPGYEGYSKPPLLFEPRKDDLASLGLNCEESLVAVDNEGCGLVPVENCEGSSVNLEEGYDMGAVKCVESFGVGCKSG